jgi:anthranilate synthase component I
VTDPWDDFIRASPGEEVAGYFERPGDSGPTSGLAAWFSGADEVITLDPRSNFRALARRADRFLRRGGRRAVLGYLGYDAVGLIEPALRRFPSGSPFPLGEFALAPEMRIGHPPDHRRRPAPYGEIREIPNDSLPRARYSASVRRLRRDIRDGEAYQVVLAHRRQWPRPTDMLDRARWLRSTERFAYFFYLRFGDRELVGASPESVVQVFARRAIVNPIAGTRPSGVEGQGRRPLASDPKELAEHRMLVDLARNDLGRVARPGSVRILRREERVRYARLEHLVSRVEAQLPRRVGPWDVLAATFPAGTVSGAPKIRATELLRREERTWRGPYAGAVGLLRPGGHADWALTIRSAFAAGSHLYTAAGAGIVYGSKPAQEFRETLTKLAHVERALVGGYP